MGTTSFSSLDDILSWQESYDLEFKSAQGRDGRGELPDSFWETYSAFANTAGGEVWLGIQEDPRNHFSVIGIKNPEKIKRALFDLLVNKNKVSANILTDKNFEVIEIGGEIVIRILIPRAKRTEKPVYLNGNPLNGSTYYRTNDGDRKCSDEMVKRMLAEQLEDSRDSRVLNKHTLDDISIESLNSYRQALKAVKPDHPANTKNDLEFLRLIGGWKRNRETSEEGLTVAGLLMFGVQQSIQEEFPHYVLDYQERPEAKTEARWVDRVTLDGTWSGNLFDFYTRVYRKLTLDLKIPFSLVDGQRKDFTPIHEALREALVNTLVHADYSVSSSILIVKRPDMFGFRNPGLMRVPIELARKGGDSDCRNKTLQQMFLLIGYAERGGFGLMKIFENWESQHWRTPIIREIIDREQVLMELYMESLLPKKTLEMLHDQFGESFDGLDDKERLILATASIEGTVNHGRLMEIVGLHPHDLTIKLRGLISRNFLDSEGQSRGTIYFVPDIKHVDLGSKPVDLGSKPVDLGSKPVDLSLPHYVQIEEMGGLEGELKEKVQGYTLGMKKIPISKTQNIVIELCEEKYLSLDILADLLDKNPNYIRSSIVQQLLKEKRLFMKFPRKPNDPRQAYTSSSMP